VAYSPVYSAAFIEYTESTPNNSFIVPDGYTAVARYLSCYQEVGAYGLLAYAANSEAAPALIFAANAAILADDLFQWEGRVVLPAGGVYTIELSTIGDGVSIYLGGFLLRNVL